MIDESDDQPMLDHLRHWASRPSPECPFSASSILQAERRLRQWKLQLLALFLLASAGSAFVLIPKFATKPSALVKESPQVPTNVEIADRHRKTGLYIRAVKKPIDELFDSQESMKSKERELQELRATILDFERTSIRNQLILTQTGRSISAP